MLALQKGGNGTRKEEEAIFKCSKAKQSQQKIIVLGFIFTSIKQQILRKVYTCGQKKKESATKQYTLKHASRER